MNRRRILATLGSIAALPAGCLGVDPDTLTGDTLEDTAPPGRLALETISDRALVRRLLYTADPNDETHAKIVEDGVSGGVTVAATKPPIPTDGQIHYDSGVYELDAEPVEETPTTVFSVKVDIVTDSVDESAAVRFSELPEVDRKKFREHGLADGETIGIGTSFLYTDAERERSALVPESEYDYITWESGEAAEWVVDDGYHETLYSYRYTGERVMWVDDYAEKVRRKYTFELSNLSGKQAAILDTAVEEGQYVVEDGTTPSEPFRSLVAAIRDHERAKSLEEEDHAGRYLLRYEGTTYWTYAALRHDFVDEKTNAENATGTAPE